MCCRFCHIFFQQRLSVTVYDEALCSSCHFLFERQELLSYGSLCSDLITNFFFTSLQQTVVYVSVDKVLGDSYILVTLILAVVECNQVPN